MRSMPVFLTLAVHITAASSTPSSAPPLVSCATTDGSIAFLPVRPPPSPSHPPTRLGPVSAGQAVACRVTGSNGSRLVWEGKAGSGGVLSLGTRPRPGRAVLSPPPAPPRPPPPAGGVLSALSISPAPAPAPAADQRLASAPAPAPAPDPASSVDDLVLIFRPSTAGGGNGTGAAPPVATSAAANTTTPTPPPCDPLTLLTGTTGALGVPRYAPRTACGWVVDPGYAPIRLTVTRFETEPGYDTVFVAALSSAGLRTPVAELSGRLAVGRTVIVPASRAFVGFLSDSSVEGGGWEFTWDRGPACLPVAEVTAELGTLSDGSLPGSGGAAAGTRCEWQVRPPPGPLAVTLTRLALPVGTSLAVQGSTRAPLRLLTGEREGRLPVIQVPESARGPAGDDAVFIVFDAGPTPGGGFALRWELMVDEGRGGEGGGGAPPAAISGAVLGQARPPPPLSISSLDGPAPPPPPAPFKNGAQLARDEVLASAASPDLGWDGFFVPPGAARAIIAFGALAGGAAAGVGIGYVAAKIHGLVVHRRYGGRWSTAPGLRWLGAAGWGSLRPRRRGRPGGGTPVEDAVPRPTSAPPTPQPSPPESPRRRRAVEMRVEQRV